jgi:hypothetical protein
MLYINFEFKHRAIEKRAREAVSGINWLARTQLIWQFLIESLMVVLLSWFVAIAWLAFVCRGSTNSGKKMTYLAKPGIPDASFFLLQLRACCQKLSSIIPVIVSTESIEGNLQSRQVRVLPRRILVVVQFTVSIVLIGTIIVATGVRQGSTHWI